MQKNRPTILIIRTSALGDVSMTVPVIYSLARQYPELCIKVLTQSRFVQLFLNPPANVSFVTADWGKKYRGVPGIFRLIRELKGQSVTHVADLHNVLRSWLIDVCFILSGIPVKMVDKRRNERKALIRRQDKQIATQKSYIHRYCDVFKRLGFPVQPDFKSLFSGQQSAEVIRLPFTLPADGSPRIGIAPFARYANKTYPTEQMEQVIRILSRKRYHLYLFGSRGAEEKVLKKWENDYAFCKALPGLLTLPQELALMSRLHVMLTMDSANMHLASLVNVPVVSVWGSTTPHCGFLGWRQKIDNAICLLLPCQPCTISGSEQCPLKHYACMKSITPERICEQIDKCIIS